MRHANTWQMDVNGCFFARNKQKVEARLVERKPYVRIGKQIGFYMERAVGFAFHSLYVGFVCKRKPIKKKKIDDTVRLRNTTD